MVYPAIFVTIYLIGFHQEVVRIPAEAQAEHAEILRYRTLRLNVGDANGWTLLEQAARQQPIHSKAAGKAFQAAQKGESFDRTDLQELAKQAGHARLLLQEALEKPYWQSPWESNATPGKKDPREIAPHVWFAQQLGAQMLLAPPGNAETTRVADVKLLLELADISIKAGLSLEDCLFGGSILGLANRFIAQRAVEEGLGASEAKALAETMDHSRATMADCHEGFRHEFAQFPDPGMKQIMDKTLHSNPVIWLLKPHFLDIQLTRQIWDQRAAGIIQSCQQTFAQSRDAFAFLKDYPAAMDEPSLLQYNAVGKILLRGLRSYEQVTGRMMLRFTEREVVSAALALRRWQMDHGGELPATLQALVPDYLPHLPVDLMDGKPLRYERQDRLLYSIGTDLAETAPATPEQKGLVSKDGKLFMRLP